MIFLDQPISVVRRNGRPLMLQHFSVWIIDNKEKRQAFAVVPAVGRVMLWSEDDYDAAGDYTQEQAEARVVHRLSVEGAPIIDIESELARVLRDGNAGR